MTTTLRERVLELLREDHGIDETGLAEQLGHVVKGEKVLEEFNASGKLVKKRVSRTPGDMARGLVIYDKLSGGQLELGGKDPHKLVDIADFYKKFAPVVDARVVRSPHELDDPPIEEEEDEGSE